jgi:quinol monooxygenase YgiN
MNLHTWCFVSIAFILSELVTNSAAFVVAMKYHQGANTQLNMANKSVNTTVNKPFCIVVDAEIHPDRIDEFLKVMEEDAAGSRAEPGCIRFDVVQNMEQKNKFMFYEVYKDTEAVDFHKKQPHFKLWTDFKESGGVVKSVSHKCDGIFMS